MAKMTPITVELRFAEDQLEALADMIASKLTEQKHPEIKAPDTTPAHNEPQVDDKDVPEVDTSDIKSQPKDDLMDWETPGGDVDLGLDLENDEPDAEEIELHDLTNAELEQIINENPLVADLLRSKMVKDELVQLVNIGFALDAGEFGELLKDDLLLAAEALGVRDEVTTKTRKDDVLALVNKTAAASS